MLVQCRQHIHSMLPYVRVKPRSDDELLKTISELENKASQIENRRCSSLNADEDEGELLVRTSMPREPFLGFLERNPQLQSKLWYHSNGLVTLFDLPSLAHDQVASEIHECLLEEFNRFGISRKDFFIPNSPRCFIGDATKEPDLAVIPKTRKARPFDTHGHPFPSVIFEIAVANETLPFLKEELGLWLSSESDVKMAIGIKIFGKRKDGTRRFVLLFAVKQSNENEDVILHELTFGDGVESGPRELIIPISVIFNSSRLPPNVSEYDMINLSLDQIHTVALECLSPWK